MPTSIARLLLVADRDPGELFQDLDDRRAAARAVGSLEDYPPLWSRPARHWGITTGGAESSSQPNKWTALTAPREAVTGLTPNEGQTMTKLALIVAAMTIAVSASAAGIDSRTVTCADLQALIAARGFIFISQATFGDFVVSNGSYCQGGGVSAFLQTRTVATSDRPECVVKYCVGRTTGSAN